MDPVTIAITAFIWWAVDWVMTPEPEPFRKTCTIVYEPSDFEINREVREPVFCDELKRVEK